jgi:hypothetical protein
LVKALYYSGWYESRKIFYCIVFHSMIKWDGRTGMVTISPCTTLPLQSPRLENRSLQHWRTMLQTVDSESGTRGCQPLFPFLHFD